MVAYRLQNLPVVTRDHLSKAQYEKWPHLYPHQTTKADREQVDILIGTDNPGFLIHREIWRENEIKNLAVEPHAEKTLLGWVIIGVPLNDTNVNLIQTI